MKIWGSITELVKVVFRSGNRETKLDAATQTGSQTDVTFRLPNLVNNSGSAVVATIVEIDLAQALTNKTIDGDLNTLQDISIASLKTVLVDANEALVRDAAGAVTSAKITNDNVDAAAAIAYSKLNLATSIVNADISAIAAIADTKLDTISTAGKVSGNAVTSGTIGGSTVVNTSGNITTSGNLAGTLTNSNTSGLTSLGYSTTTAAANSTITPAADRPVIVITSVVSATINALANPANGKQVFLVNDSSSDLIINEDSGSPATNGILTGTGGTFTLKDGASVSLLYNTSMNRWTLSGGAGGSGAGTTIAAIGGAAGYPIGTPVYLSGSVVLPATAAAANTAEVIGLVSAEPTSSNYDVLLLGAIEIVSASAYDTGVASAAGTVLFLSPTAGKLTAVEPSIIGQVSVPLAVASGGTGIVVSPKRGVVLGGTNARTQLNLPSASPTAIFNAASPSLYTAGELTGWVQLGTSQKFYFRAPFAQNGGSTDWNISPSYVGDTPPAGFSITMANTGVVTMTCPTFTGTGLVNYALNAPAVGATFPLAVDGGSLTTGTVAEARLPNTYSGLLTLNGGALNTGLTGTAATTAVTAGSGKVGEKYVLTFPNSASTTASPVTGTWYISSLFTLTAGVWSIFMDSVVLELQGAAGTTARGQIAFTNASAVPLLGTPGFLAIMTVGSPYTNYQNISCSGVLVLSATTDIKLSFRVNSVVSGTVTQIAFRHDYAGGGNTVTAIRIA